MWHSELATQKCIVSHLFIKLLSGNANLRTYLVIQKVNWFQFLEQLYSAKSIICVC